MKIFLFLLLLTNALPSRANMATQLLRAMKGVSKALKAASPDTVRTQPGRFVQRFGAMAMERGLISESRDRLIEQLRREHVVRYSIRNSNGRIILPREDIVPRGFQAPLEGSFVETDTETLAVSLLMIRMAKTEGRDPSKDPSVERFRRFARSLFFLSQTYSMADFVDVLEDKDFLYFLADGLARLGDNLDSLDALVLSEVNRAIPITAAEAPTPPGSEVSDTIRSVLNAVGATREQLAPGLYEDLPDFGFRTPSGRDLYNVPTEQMRDASVLVRFARSAQPDKRRFVKALFNFMGHYSRNFFGKTNRAILGRLLAGGTLQTLDGDTDEASITLEISVVFARIYGYPWRKALSQAALLESRQQMMPPSLPLLPPPLTENLRLRDMIQSLGIPHDKAILEESLREDLEYLGFLPPGPHSFDDIPIERMGASALLIKIAMTGEGQMKRFASALLGFMKTYSRNFFDPTARTIYLRFADRGLAAFDETPTQGNKPELAVLSDLLENASRTAEQNKSLPWERAISAPPSDPLQH